MPKRVDLELADFGQNKNGIIITVGTRECNDSCFHFSIELELERLNDRICQKFFAHLANIALRFGARIGVQLDVNHLADTDPFHLGEAHPAK